MLVVADSSPVIVLVTIDHIRILPALFREVAIPPQVVEELTRASRTAEVREFIAAPPPWLVERSPSYVETIETLHAGEMAAISLARELKADLLLIDEVEGRKAAAARDIPFAGTIGVLERAADQGLLDLAEAFDRIKGTNFWVSHTLLDARLRMHRSRKR
jgi:predicted nucleic acid-binding protein